MKEKLDYSGKTVLITGHTGFKGAWLSIWLAKLGAKVIGFSSPSWPNDFVYKNTNLQTKLHTDEKGDITNYTELKLIFDKHKPEIVFHLAAQPLVKQSYDEPLETFNTNIMGTANVLECIKNTDSVKAAVIITTDKCYKNKEQPIPYKEDDELGGHDPYSCSKACAELVINTYRKSFFQHSNQPKLVASARAGNVLGGGDFGKDRLIPDCINALKKGKDISIRNPSSIRPWQFVLEPIYGYLLLGHNLLNGKQEFADAWNFGPEESSAVPVQKVVELMINFWGSGNYTDTSDPNEKQHEAKLLMLDINKSKTLLGWKPQFQLDKTIQFTVEWYKQMENKNPEELLQLCNNQIDSYEKELQ